MQILLGLKEYLLLLGIFDFAILGFFFLIFLFFLLTALLFKKSLLVAFFLFLLSILSIIVAPVVGNYIVKNYVNKSSLHLESSKKLHFYDAYLLSGYIENIGKREFKQCILELNIYTPSENPIKNALNRYLKPLHKESFVISGPILVGDSKDFRFLLEGFSYSNFKSEVSSRCY